MMVGCDGDRGRGREGECVRGEVRWCIDGVC